MRILILLTAAYACGQNLSLGVIGGFSPRADFQNQFSPAGSSPGFTNYSTSRHWIVGAMLEYRFTPQFSLEADGLYHSLGYTFAGVEPDGSLNSISPATVVTWEFPVLAKYRFSFRGASPFIEAGPSFRSTGNLNSANPSHYGVIAGVGIEAHVKNLNIAPTVRYTRWAADPPHSVKTVSDQIEVLVAFSSQASSNWHPLGSRFSLGFIGGVDVLGDYRPQSFHYLSNLFSLDNSQSSGPRSFQGGAALEMHLTRNFSVEGDILHETLKQSIKTRTSGPPSPDALLLPHDYTASLPEWKFPLLAKYRIERRSLSPIVELGPTFRIPPGASTFSNHGVTAGLGFESRWKWLRISPVARYTRWAAESFPEFTRGNRNQLDLLAGFSF